VLDETFDLAGGRQGVIKTCLVLNVHRLIQSQKE
jgi:hypothetical protein